MISSIEIHGYRGFTDFEMTGLKRVNLLVGTNNSGKTSALEAVYLLTTRGDPSALWNILWRRGERVLGVDRNDRPVELEVSHLFNGHDIALGSQFSFIAKNETPERQVRFTIGEIKTESPPGIAGREAIGFSRLGLHVKATPRPPVNIFPLSRSGGISSDIFDIPRRHRRRIEMEALEIPAQLINSESRDGTDLIALWDKVQLTPNETRVLDALKLLDPGLERIGAQAGAQSYIERGGFIVKLKGHDRPIPIGSMGDGMWRMLAMAIAIDLPPENSTSVKESSPGV